MVIAGSWELGRNLLNWHSPQWPNFIVYAILSFLAGSVKLRLPGITGTISAGFVLVLFGIVSLDLASVLAVASSSILIQSYWGAKTNPGLVKVLFNLTDLVLATSASFAVFHSHWLRSLPLEEPLMLALLGSTYFIITTGLMAGVIGLSESKPAWPVWSGSYFWAFPYYLLGAATAGLLQVIRQHSGWQTSMLAVPVMYLVYRAYRMHVKRLLDEKKRAELQAAKEAAEAADQAKSEFLLMMSKELHAVSMHNDQLLKSVELKNQEVQALSAGHVNRLEEERRHISRELHDEAGQVLIGIKLALQVAAIQIPEEWTELRRGLDDLREMVNDATRRLKDLARWLRPPTLDQLGLEVALRQLATDLQKKAGLELRLDLEAPDPRLPQSCEIALYRIAQEALTNVLRHSKAQTASLELRTDSGQVRLCVRDDGRGFDGPGTGGGLGLLGMRERAGMLGGVLTIDSSPNRGTLIRVEVPLPRNPITVAQEFEQPASSR